MSHLLSRAALAAALVSLPVLAQQQLETVQNLRLVHGTFDPSQETLPIAETLRGDARTNLWIVQFEGLPTQTGRDLVTQAGGEIHGYLPDNAYVVRMDQTAAQLVRQLGVVRSATYYHPAFRLEPTLRTALADGQDLGRAQYNVVAVDKRNDKPALIQKIRALGGTVLHEQTGSILVETELTTKQLREVSRLDEVLWIDRLTATGEDMDNARIQGGGNYVESQGGYTGSGVNAHIYEGIEASHPDFTGVVTPVNTSNTAASHGHATAGIVFGNGTSNPAVRGMAPDCGKFFTNYSGVTTSRYQVVDDLINVHNVSHTTASWGNSRTRAYTSISAEADDIIFDHDMAWTQSQSNAGNQDSRPQAWAKNIFSIGGVRHNDNSNPGDDSWAAGGASTGPAADGRIKPTLCAYYDNIGTSDLTGSSGYSSGNWTSGFGGTSGATPIVAGHNVLAIQMFTDGIFGNALRNPGGSRHSNRPKFTTLKALQVVSAAQYSFNAGSTDNRREHQGWGFPDLRKMYDNRNKTFIIDETDVLTQGQTTVHGITVAAGETELKIAMSYSDPAANPSANPTRINDLTLRVTSPGGTVYWGNNGLEQGVWSVAGGSADTINTSECVFVQSPQAGAWAVEVIATLVAQDSHVETPGVDADYGLVVSGGTGGPVVTPGQFSTFGAGCANSVVLPGSSSCAQLNGTGGTLSGSVAVNEYAYEVLNSGSLTVTGFEVYSNSNTGGNETVAAYLYSDSGAGPNPNPIATTTVTVGSTPGFYAATFASPVNVSGNFYVAIDHTAGTVLLANLSSGTPGNGYWRRPANGGGAWSLSGIISTPSYTVQCQGGGTGTNAVAEIGNVGVASIGNSFSVTLDQAPPSALALLVLGYSDSSWSGGSLPAPLAGAPGCDLLISPDDWTLQFTDGSGQATQNLNVPSLSTLVGIDAFHQWVIADPTTNSLGVVTSNGGKSTVGG